MKPNQPEVLGYDSDVKGQQNRGRWAVRGFAIGALLGILFVAFMGCSTYGQFNLKLAIALGILDLMSLLPVAMVGLWTAIWWKHSTNPIQAFRSFPVALVCGAAVVVGPRFLIFSELLVIILVAALALILGRLLCVNVESHEWVPITGRQSRRMVFVWSLIAAISLGGGMLMALYGRDACEEHMARRAVARRPMHLKDNSDIETAAIYRRIGITMLPAGTDQTDRFPWAEVGRAKVDMPFVVSVKYGWVWEPQYGGGGKKRLLYFFGMVLELGDDGPSWST